ncbi:MAG: hypothetical protein ABI946_07885 [Chthoniobacterales bacterium]
MKATARKLLMKYGRKLLQQVQMGIGRASRVVLFMDVLRPLSFPMSAIDRFIINGIAASPFITDAKKNHEAWGQRIDALWR